MPLQLNTPPASEPVTLAQAKAWLRVESGDDEDALIASLIAAARTRAEWHTGRAFITQHWTLWLDRWDREIPVPLAPLQSVQSVTLRTIAGDTVLAQDAWRTSDQRLLLSQPVTGDSLAVAFTCGYGNAADDVPAPIGAAILQIVASLYDHRGGDAAPTPDSALALLAPYRILNL